jgi:hypothetical protein
MDDNQLLGNELFDRLKSIQDAELQAAHNTIRKLRKGENVSDSELLVALFAFSVRLDLASPLLPICHETIKRLMVYGGITETPRGIKRTWLEDQHGD